MKHKVSITIDDVTLQTILQAVETGKFRSKSHAFEYAIRKMMENV